MQGKIVSKTLMVIYLSNVPPLKKKMGGKQRKRDTGNFTNISLVINIG